MSAMKDFEDMLRLNAEEAQEWLLGGDNRIVLDEEDDIWDIRGCLTSTLDVSIHCYDSHWDYAAEKGYTFHPIQIRTRKAGETC